MKRRILALAGTMAFATMGHALLISEANFNQSKDTLELQVTYGGGCKEHGFQFWLEPTCTQMGQTFRCSAKLVETKGSDDPCERINSRRIDVNMSTFTKRPAYLRVSTANGSSADVLITQSQK